MSENASSEGASLESDKPAQATDDVKFPPLPEPGDSDFEEDVGEEEKAHYRSKFPDLNEVVNIKLHCTACDRHLGCSARNESRMRLHPMLKTLICHACHSFYNSGEFDKGEDGSELYCRWCGQGGQVYCCSECIHVFCAKCIKRNFGITKIREIENTDDWKCFKCNPRCLWDMRAICWALLHYCDYRNRIVDKTEDPQLKDKYMKIISVDTSECCRKGRKREKPESAKKKEKEAEHIAKKIISKMPATIQVKKFASINVNNDAIKNEKKPQKRPASPKNRMSNVLLQKPVQIAPCNIISPPLLKKIRLPSTPILTPVRIGPEKRLPNTYTRFTTSRPRAPFPIPIMNTPYNGFSNTYNNVSPNILGDNINLSLETLTQGLDMAAVAAFNNSSNDENDVVCTPDFPIEPLCEVTEDNDDDVECITPGPVVVPPKISNPPPLVPRSLPDLSNDNIVQMTENDVTVNALTGGLKFRVDPQTLSSKKMYRLPDGRIFAINPNPNMPGGYSATIVSVSETSGKVAPKSGETYAAKLSTVVPSKPLPRPLSKLGRNAVSRNHAKNKYKNPVGRPKITGTPKSSSKETVSTEHRKSDFKVPVEWYRYNLVDAVDALEYSLSRLNKLRKEATTTHLRTRTIEEMKYLHRTLEQVLSTSSKRFLEIRENLNRELKLFVNQKMNGKKGEEIISEIDDDDDDDDDVEILPDAGNDDPIFIDENSIDSIDEPQEVDLTGAASSEHNDSNENKNDSDPLCTEQSAEKNKEVDKSINRSCDSTNETQNEDVSSIPCTEKSSTDEKTNDKEHSELNDNKDNESAEKPSSESLVDNEANTDKEKCDKEANPDKEECDEEASPDKECDKGNKSEQEASAPAEIESENSDKQCDNDKSAISESSTAEQESSALNGDDEKETNNGKDESMEIDSNGQIETQDKADNDDEKTQTLDMSEDLINTLLQDDNLDNVDNVFNANSLDIPDDL